MKRFLLLLLLLPALSVSGAKNQLDSLLNELDLVIKNRTQFNRIRELRIDSLKAMITADADAEDSYKIYHRLYREYRNYNMDSALYMATKKHDIARVIGNEQYQYTANMNISEILGIMGMYKEAFDIADEIGKDKLDKDQLPYFYHLYHSTYSLLYENSLTQKEKSYYGHLVSLYKDSLLQVNDPQSIGYLLVENGKLVELGQYEKALALMTNVIKKIRIMHLSLVHWPTGSPIYTKNRVIPSSRRSIWQYLPYQTCAKLLKAISLCENLPLYCIKKAIWTGRIRILNARWRMRLSARLVSGLWKYRKHCPL